MAAAIAFTKAVHGDLAGLAHLLAAMHLPGPGGRFGWIGGHDSGAAAKAAAA